MSGVGERDSAGINLGADVLGELEEGQALGDVGLAAADLLGEAALRVAVFRDERPVRLGLVTGVQVPALAVVHQSDLQSGGELDCGPRDPRGWRVTARLHPDTAAAS